jgi:hypothetical protein
MNNIKLIYASSLHWLRGLALSNLFYLAPYSKNISRKRINQEGPCKAIYAQPPVTFPLLGTVQVQFTVPRCPSPGGRWITSSLAFICVLRWSFLRFLSTLKKIPKFEIYQKKATKTWEKETPELIISLRQTIPCFMPVHTI